MEGNIVAEETKWFGFINPTLFHLKVVYFTYISSLTVIRPYLSLFLIELGLTQFQVGLRQCLEPGAILLLSPVWGFIADKLQRRKYLLILCIFGSFLFLPTLLVIPPVEEDYEYPSLIHINQSGQNNASNFSLLQQEIDNDNTGTGRIGNAIFPAVSTVTFALVAAMSLLDNVFIAGFLPLFDAQTMAVVSQHPGASYGGQRWTGALAVVVFSPFAGLVTDWYKTLITGEEVFFLRSSYVPCFILFSFLMMISIIPIVKTEEVYESESGPPSSFSGELSAVFCQLHVIVTFVVFIVAGACKGLVVSFLFIYLKELGASNFLMSLSLVATCVVEVPCLLISKKVIKVFGYEAVICMGLVAYALRLFGYSVLENPWYVLPIELLHGVCYGILWPACTEYANHIAPDGMSTTIQALTHAAKAGVGETIGTLVGGLIYNLYGGRVLFQLFAVVSVFVTLLYILDSVRVYCSVRSIDSPENDGESESTESDPLFGKSKNKFRDIP